MRTLIIGRSRYADVVIADPSVAPYHAGRTSPSQRSRTTATT
jgi:hypothetical protein